MLTIHINKNPDGLVTYFTNSLAKDDYFFSGKSITGRTHGKLSAELGLSKKVTKKEFSQLAHGINPKTGESLTVRNRSHARTSIEYTFSASKSVSILMALSDKSRGKEILNAHRRAVKYAMKLIERDMQTRVSIGGRRVYQTTGNISYMRFDHLTARPTKSAEYNTVLSEMQLHSHAIVWNATRVGNRLQAIEASTIHRNAPYYEAVYHSMLAKGLFELGYLIERSDNRFEIKSPGLTKATRDKYSTRTKQINALAKKLGITNKKKLAQLGSTSRLNKSAMGENVDLVKAWKSRLTPLEKRGIELAKGDVRPALNSLDAKTAIDRSIAHHLERNSTASVKRVMATALSLGYGTITPKDVHRELKSRDNILYARRGYISHMTTKEMVKMEDKMIDYVAQGKNTLLPINPDYVIDNPMLNDKQRESIQTILRSPSRVVLLNGAAGSGKSTVLGFIKKAIQEKNKRIIAVAPSTAATEVLRSKGYENSITIAGFFKSREMKESLRNQVLLVDEASMIGVRQMNKLFNTSHKVNARIILASDIRQHSSPSAGDAVRILQEKANIQTANIDKIVRQRKNPQLLRAIELLSKRENAKGFKALEELKAIEEIDDTDARNQKIAEAYVRSLEAKRSALVIAPTNIEGKILSDTIRAEMKKRGRLSGEEKSFIIQRNLSFTEAQKKDVANYSVGSRIQFHQNAKGGFVAGIKYDVLFVTDNGKVLVNYEGDKRSLVLPLDAHERFQVFKKDDIALSKGDGIRITTNGKTKEKSKVSNGHVYQVSGFTKDGHIELSNGKTLDKSFANFKYSYVSTSHSSQGKDAVDTYVSISAISLPAVNEKTLYVSASRAKETLKIFTDDKQALKQAVMRSGDRMSAKEVETRHIERRRKRRLYYKAQSKNVSKNERSKKQPAFRKILGAFKRTPTKE